MTMVVSGMGMICSVGRNVGDSCASIRAGITRARQLDYFDLLDPETQEPLPVVGHPIRGFTEGFTGVGLWLRLAERCLAEVLDNARVQRDDAAFWRKTGFIAVVPYLDDSRYYGDGGESPDLLMAPYVRPLLKRARVPIDEANISLVSAGHAGVIAALQRAHDAVGQKVDRVIIVAADCYLDVLTLEWLATQLRLKSPESPLGLMPGEAAAALMIEDDAACRKRGGSAAALVAAAHVAREQSHLKTSDVNKGVGMAEAIDRALAAAGTSGPYAGDVVSDLNGEEWRARELFGALQLLGNRVAADVPVITPAASTGDVGAASGGIAVCSAVRSLQRAYARQAQSLVVSSSDRGEVGAALVVASS